MSFEDDQVPVKYPTQNPDNPTWTGPNALGDARDKSAEAVARIKDLQGAVSALAASTKRLEDAAAADVARDASLLAEIREAAGVSADEVVTKLIAPLSAAILAGLPVDGADLTVADVETAVRNVLVHGTEDN
jgi:hypothetical protein